MAARNEDHDPETGRDLCRVRRDGERRGYRKDILTDNLSERDAVFICVRCQGILREVCLSSDGEQFCASCKKEGEQANPSLQVDNMILSFKCSCPLITRGCKWLGALGGCQDHLDTCGYVLGTCKLRCGVVLQRDEVKVHEKEKCPQRIMECKHCRRELKSCELATHLEMCCKMEVSCELKCGVVMCREDVTQHVEKECSLVVETCVVGCGVKMTRDELKIHRRDNCLRRIAPCNHCLKDFEFFLLAHHDSECPKMNIPCNLCGEVMCREDVTQHVEKECSLVVETCVVGCGVKMTRGELKIHRRDNCLRRIAPCNHCLEGFEFFLLAHHDSECPKMNIPCNLCGVVMCREDIQPHIDQNCPEKEIKCPFAKYKCVGLMKRKNLRNHLDEKRMEHLELKMDTMQECMLEESAKQNVRISDQNTTITTMSCKIQSLEEEVEILTKLTKAIKLVWRITEVPGSGCISSIREQFQVVGYNLKFLFYNSSSFYNYSFNLQIKLCPQRGLNYDKLKWSFKAEFVIHLSSQSNPRNIKKFKSEVFEWKREDFHSISYRSPIIIATFTIDEFMEHFINGEAEFEIFVILL